jgi:UMF1 family MFS transporter
MALYLVGPNGYVLGTVLLVFANVAFGASIVVYNAFLPDIAGPNERDDVSSRGWAFGFLGGGILLIFNLVLYLQAESFGVAQDQAVRISLLSAGAWWALWSIIPITGLRKVRNPGLVDDSLRELPTTTWTSAVGARLGELKKRANTPRL